MTHSETTETAMNPIEYKTDDLAMATFLTSSGHTHQRLERRGNSCLWIFIALGNVFDLVEQYQTGGARVEPCDFTIASADLRREMHSFMGRNGNGR